MIFYVFKAYFDLVMLLQFSERLGRQEADLHYNSS
jgi:hypothetical protein